MNVIIIASLIVALLAALVSSLGVLLARDAFDRLHYLGPVKIVGSLCIFVAVILQEGFTQMSGKAALVIVLILMTGPVITHAAARAGFVRGDARRLRGEEWEVNE